MITSTSSTESKTLSQKRPYVLSVAGFDPSGGAGVLADVKTFEQHKVLGAGVVTGLTFQNDSQFEGVKWIETEEIMQQVLILTRKFKFEYIKIGMIKDLDVLSAIVSQLRALNSKPRLIWDPILKASAGFEIHSTIDKEKLTNVCRNVYLVTPNMDEIKALTGEPDEKKAATVLSGYCNVLLKGGHIEPEAHNQMLGKDYLFTTGGSVFPFRPKKISDTGKHGSGCVLSSAIAANLALGNDLRRSCLKGKDYVTKFLTSNKTLLGYHKI